MSEATPLHPGPALPPERYFRLSTGGVALGDRRAFWRDVALNRTEADFPRDAPERPFTAQVRGFLGIASELREGKSDAVIMRRTAARCRQDGVDEIMLSLLVSSDGPALYQKGDTTLSVPVGRMAVNDSSVPFTVVMQRYRSVNFRLPRAAVTDAVGGDPWMLAGRLLSATPLNRLLFSYLTRFVDEMEEMDDRARQIALDAATDFTLAALRMETRGGQWEEGTHGKGLRQAARRFVDGNLHRQDLDPEMLARALRCSRTHLYREFASSGETVMGFVREARLARSRAMLADPACRQTIGEIAMHCGFEDPSAFSRSFRRRYGCQPGEARRELRDTLPLVSSHGAGTL